MTGNADAYDHLAFNKKQKDLVLFRVNNHNERTMNIVAIDSSCCISRPFLCNVIQRKGQRFMILFPSPAGSGRSLTAGHPSQLRIWILNL